MDADILGTGTICTIKGKLSGQLYEGVLYSSSNLNPGIYDGKKFLVDVEATEGHEVIAAHGIYVFQDDQPPLEKIKGPYYLVIDARPIIGKAYTSLEDLRGDVV